MNLHRQPTHPFDSLSGNGYEFIDFIFSCRSCVKALQAE